MVDGFSAYSHKYICIKLRRIHNEYICNFQINVGNSFLVLIC